MFLRRQPTSSPVRRRIRAPWKAGVGCAAIAIACAACSGTSPPAPLGTPVGGAIQILVTSKSVDPVGNPVKVTTYYPATDRSATAVVLLGHFQGPQDMTMTWSKLTPAGPQLLLSKQMMVTSYGRAYATVVTRGTLPIGTYQVTASLDGATQTTEWAVYAPQHSNRAALARTAAPLRIGRTAALPQSPLPGHLCAESQTITKMVSPTEMDLNISATCPETGSNKVTRGAILATMSHGRGVRLIGMMHMEPGGMIVGNYRFNVCTLPAGSNLPGAHLAITAIVYYLGLTRDFSFAAGLPADISGPSIRIHPSVPPGTSVHPGQKITLTVTAAESTRLGTQIGIRDIRVDGPLGRVAAASYRREKGGCNPARGDRTIKVTYTVPQSAPKVIKLVGITSDWPGNAATTAISYPVAG